MLAAVCTQALFVVADVAYLRGAGVILAFVRTFLGRKRFVTSVWDGWRRCARSSRSRARVPRPPDQRSRYAAASMPYSASFSWRCWRYMPMSSAALEMLP